MWELFGSVFMFSNFYQLKFQNEALVALANLQQNIIKKMDWKSNLIDLVLISEVHICRFLG